MATKTKRTDVTISKKIEAIQQVEERKKSKSQIAKDFGIPPSTLSTWIKCSDKIKQAVEEGKNVKGRKRIRGAKHADVENELFEWLCHMRAERVPLSGPIVQKKAEEIAYQIGIEGFKCSTGWLNRFKERFNIVCLTVAGQSGSVDVAAADEWVERNRPIFEAYAESDVFNTDETGLFYNLTPAKTLAVRGSTCHGGKLSKQRLTILLCCNADGSEKCPPLVIGKALNPRCMKTATVRGVRQLPCQYDANKNAWMTAKIFRQWLMCLQGKMAIRNRKILLLLDGVSSHNIDGLELPNVKCMFLPPNTTSHLQPLDQGIIADVKKRYRTRLVRYLIREISRNVPMNDVKQWNVLDAMRQAVAAWNEVPATTIRNCFAKPGFVKSANEAECHDNQKQPIADFEWNLIQVNEKSEGTFDDYVAVDDNLTVHAPTTAFDNSENDNSRDKSFSMDDGNNPDDEIETGDLVEELEVAPRAPICRKDAYSALSTLEMVLQDNSDQVTEDVYEAMDKLVDFVHKTHSCKTVKQTVLTDFFH